MTKKEINASFELNIYFDFNDYSISDTAQKDLRKLLLIMNSDRKLEVEIGAHTDSRGSSKYNHYLSRKRAKSVLYWLKENGVYYKRMNYKGYGESRLKNDCSNGVKCSEQEHQLNRRVEIRVVGM